MDKHIRSLDTPEGFETQFWQLVQEYSTYELAYEAVERQRSMHFEGRKYANYNSFRNSKAKRKGKNEPEN